MSSISDIVEAFDEFKQRNAAMIEDKFKALEAKGNRPGAGAIERNSETKAAMARFVKAGDLSVFQSETKALNVTSGPDGGYAVPQEIDAIIAEQLRNMGGLRTVANVVPVGTGAYKKLVNVHGSAATWVGETSSRPETDSPNLEQVAPPMGELYANPSATQFMLDDVNFDASGWLVEEIAKEFALAENTAFVSGNGTNKPKGFLDYTANISSDAARTFGHLQLVKTGVAGGFTATTTSSNPVDNLLATVHSLKAAYRANATWIMNTATLERVRKFRDVDGNYIWRPGAEQGQPSLLLGYPVLEADDMPDVATNTTPIAFGDWKSGYTIVDRLGTTVLRDPYTNKPFVHFYATKRVGGAVIDSNAIKLLATQS